MTYSKSIQLTWFKGKSVCRRRSFSACNNNQECRGKTLSSVCNSFQQIRIQLHTNIQLLDLLTALEKYSCRCALPTRLYSHNRVWNDVACTHGIFRFRWSKGFWVKQAIKTTWIDRRTTHLHQSTLLNRWNAQNHLYHHFYPLAVQVLKYQYLDCGVQSRFQRVFCDDIRL